MNSRETGGGGQTFPVERNQPSMVEEWANVLIGWQVNKESSDGMPSKLESLSWARGLKSLPCSLPSDFEAFLVTMPH